MVVNLYRAVSYVHINFDSVTSSSLETFWQRFTPTESENEKVTEEEAPSIGSSTLFFIGGIFKIKSMDLSLQKTRINDDKENSTKLSDSSSRNGLAEVECPDSGILITLQQTVIDMSSEEEKLGISVEISEIQSLIFGYKNQKVKNMDQSALRDLLLQSCDCLYEISLSNCICSLSSFLHQSSSFSRDMHNKSSGSTSSSNVVQNLKSSNTIIQDSDPDPTHALLVDLELGTVYGGSCSLKSALIEAHDVNKLLSSLSIGGKFQTISWEIQVIFSK